MAESKVVGSSIASLSSLPLHAGAWGIKQQIWLVICGILEAVPALPIKERLIVTVRPTGEFSSETLQIVL